MSSNCDSRLLPSISAVMPVRSEMKKTVRRFGMRGRRRWGEELSRGAAAALPVLPDRHDARRHLGQVAEVHPALAGTVPIGAARRAQAEDAGVRRELDALRRRVRRRQRPRSRRRRRRGTRPAADACRARRSCSGPDARCTAWPPAAWIQSTASRQRRPLVRDVARLAAGQVALEDVLASRARGRPRRGSARSASARRAARSSRTSSRPRRRPRCRPPRAHRRCAGRASSARRESRRGPAASVAFRGSIPSATTCIVMSSQLTDSSAPQTRVMPASARSRPRLARGRSPRRGRSARGRRRRGRRRARRPRRAAAGRPSASSGSAGRNGATRAGRWKDRGARSAGNGTRTLR